MGGGCPESRARCAREVREGRAAASALSRRSALLAQLLGLGVAELSSASATEQL